MPAECVIPCSYCQARAGELCRDKKGNITRNHLSHKSRREDYKNAVRKQAASNLRSQLRNV